SFRGLRRFHNYETEYASGLPGLLFLFLLRPARNLWADTADVVCSSFSSSSSSSSSSSGPDPGFSSLLR
ncbi:hypothetical protein, partial [Alistipes finegoldii]|uniref:hypothetical protein n=1 Tax=Alistipes finegoldii TaxID=214856 RepID=UPI00242F105B